MALYYTIMRERGEKKEYWDGVLWQSESIDLKSWVTSKAAHRNAVIFANDLEMYGYTVYLRYHDKYGKVYFCEEMYSQSLEGC